MENLVRYPNCEYIMPFLFTNDLYIPVLNELLKEDFKCVKQIFGAIPSSWTGGRISSLKIKNPEIINKYLGILTKKYNITSTFTFSALSINEDTLKDEYSNILLDIAYQNNCYYIVASNLLYNHIKARYPNAKMVCSVIQPQINFLSSYFNETEFYNKMLDKYEIVVVRPEWAIENVDKIDKIISDINRIEILVNLRCQYNCKIAKQHYLLVEDIDSNRITIDEAFKNISGFCQSNNKNVRKTYMPIDIVDKLVLKGVKKIKIKGRGESFNSVYSYLYDFFFNQNYKEEDIKNKIDLICAKYIQNSKELQLKLVKNL